MEFLDLRTRRTFKVGHAQAIVINQLQFIFTWVAQLAVELWWEDIRLMRQANPPSRLLVIRMEALIAITFPSPRKCALSFSANPFMFTELIRSQAIQMIY